MIAKTFSMIANYIDQVFIESGVFKSVVRKFHYATLKYKYVML